MRRFFVLFLTILPLAHPASISIYEQQKYKQFLSGQGLYNADDDVVILTVHNFKSQVLNSPYAWFVEFYNSWCGFCQRFAPSWKALGTDVKGWGDLVKIGALDCSVDENTPICRDYEVMAYPTLRYFYEGYREGIGATVQKGDDFLSQRQNLLEHILGEKKVGRGAQFSLFSEYTENDLDDVFSSTNADVQYVFLVLERTGRFLGASVALDLHRMKNVAVKFSTNEALVSKYGIESIPVVIAVDGRKNYRILSSNDTREGVRGTVSNFLNERHVLVTEIPPHREIFTGKWLEADVPDMSDLINERARQALQKKIKLMGDVVFQMDLETALRYSLKHEIATTKVITGEKLKVLKSYFNLLRKYFPFGPQGHIFLTELSIKADIDSLDTSNLNEIINRAENGRVFSSPQNWLACRGSVDSYRGYPCGLWKLFHYLTVNAAERNRNLPTANPLEVLEVMHGYVKYFFGCHDCSQHFQQMVIEREMRNVSSQDSAVLWLWLAHNQVNKRLSGDQTEDPEFPKIQFPLKERCPLCRNSDNSWDLSQVLVYLKLMYSSLNVRYIGSDSTILHQALQHPLRTDDMSMCFILYVCSFILIALLIRIFLKRGYRKKPYVHDLLGKV